MGLQLRHLKTVIAVALLGLSPACTASPASSTEDEAGLPELGLMGTIPIYWGESGSVNQLLAGEGSEHWARAKLEASYRLEPLDALTAANLADLHYLLLAQPRALSGSENVALDAWVRDGGQLLLFADPMMTGESQFPIGDRRRPQDVILLSPILARWGLQLQFDEAQPAGFALLDGAEPIPVNLAGHFALTAGQADCSVGAGGVLARCAIGRGQAIVLADAAVLDLYDPHPAAPAALAWLVREGFGPAREMAGNRARTAQLAPE